MFAFKGRERRREEGVGETKSHRLKEGGGGWVWRESETRDKRNQTTRVSSQDGVKLQELHACLRKSEAALGFPLPPPAPGEAGPSRPAGTGVSAWETVLARRLWPSNRANATRVSQRATVAASG